MVSSTDRARDRKREGKRQPIQTIYNPLGKERENKHKGRTRRCNKWRGLFDPSTDMAKTLHMPVVEDRHEIVKVDGALEQPARGVFWVPAEAVEGVVFDFAVDAVAA